MLTRSLFSIAGLALSAVSAIAQDVPTKLAPPQERPLLGKYAAKGVQIYICSLKGGANEWAFKAPEAELTDAQGKVFAKHYAGPTWEAPDGSKIVGKVLVNEPAPKPGAIPWLLLSTESWTFRAGRLKAVCRVVVTENKCRNSFPPSGTRPRRSH